MAVHASNAGRLQGERMYHVKAVMLDYGLVLCRKPLRKDIDTMSGFFRLTTSEFWHFYEKNRLAFDRGDLSPLEYWTAFGNDTGVQLDQAKFELLIDLDIRMWEILDRKLFDWVELIKSKGYRTALLSNMHLRFATHIRRNRSWLELFDHRFFSAELHLAKPDTKIFEFVLNEMRLSPEEILFIDDRAANISAARSLGFETILYADSKYLKQELQSAGFPWLPATG
jgi:putative hydrolase of the HAD superfamily